MPAAASVRQLVACANDLTNVPFDAEQAFVESKMEHEIYLKLPQGVVFLPSPVVINLLDR